MAIRCDVATLEEELERLRGRIEMLEEDCRETRWLELETRRDIYVRICRELAPDLRVADDYEPKILVTLRNDVVGLTDDAPGRYFSLVPSEGNPSSNKWVADASLSRYIVALLGSDDNDDTHLQLGVVGLDGNMRELAVRWDSIRHVRGASDLGRAILTIDSRWSMGASEMLNAIVSTLTINDVGAILVRHGRFVPSISNVRKRVGEDEGE